MFSIFGEWKEGFVVKLRGGGEEVGVMKMKMKRWQELNHEVLGNHIMHFLSFFFFSRLWDFVRSFKIGSDIIRFAFLQQFSTWCEKWRQVGQEWCWETR